MKMPGGGAYGRGATAEVRNPVLRLPATQALINQAGPEARRLLGELLRQLADQAAEEGERCWRRGKAMMGAYLRVVGVYAKHIAHAIDRRSDRPATRFTTKEGDMAHAYHHAVSSAKRFGGTAADYQPIHDWLDGSKLIVADFRHRALRHHAEGCYAAEALFGTTITNSNGKAVPVRLIAEQHILEDLGRIPSFADWVRCIRAEPWMGRNGTKLNAEGASDGNN